MEKLHGLKAVDYIYHNRNYVARKLKDSGKKVIGYLCNFAPPELITAAGFVPFKIMGVVGENIVKADKCIEAFGCPYVRSCLEQDLLGRLDFMHGFVFPHSCDMVQRIYGIWVNECKPRYAHLLNVPHIITSWSKDFFKRELEFFKESLEECSGQKITEESLKKSIRIYNELRLLYKKLSTLRQEKPWVLSGSEMTKISVAGVTVPPEEFIEILKEVLEEVTSRSNPGGERPRLMLWGCPVDNTMLADLVDECGASLVVEDTCVGTRSYFGEVDEFGDVMEELSKQYFENFMCPRTQRGTDLDRFNYILELAQDYKVKGVIAYMIHYCDCHKLDYPDLRDYLKDNGIAVLPIEDDYSLKNTEALRNRLDAFIEMF